MGGPGAAAGVFDGIDIDWEWPGSEGNAGNVIRPEDKQTTRSCWPSSASNWTRTAPHATGATCSPRSCPRHRRRSMPGSRPTGSSTRWTWERCRATTCTAPGRRRRITSRTCRSTKQTRQSRVLGRRHGRGVPPARCPERRTGGRRAVLLAQVGPASARRTMVSTNRRLDLRRERGRPVSTTTRSRRTG